jgi:putative effector of murein hydrolase
MMVLAAYMTRGLLIALGSSKRATTERAEELGDETDEIPIAETPRSGFQTGDSPSISESPSSVALNGLVAPPRSQLSQQRSVNTTREDLQGWQNQDSSSLRPTMYVQTPLPPHRAQRWSAWLSSHTDLMSYSAMFLLVGLPVYYAVDYAMPIQLTFSVLMYFTAMAIPPRWRQYLHPVLVSSLLTVLGLWALATTKGDSLQTSLRQYRTGAKYLQLWQKSSHGAFPGAGDMFGTILDASIVALALPMYQYRRELREHFLAIVVPNIVISIGSLFSYPFLCYAIGIGAKRSLAFAARSLTLALATPATENLGGDGNTVAALAIMSGILGVLVGERMLALLRIPEGMSSPYFLSLGKRGRREKRV